MSTTEIVERRPLTPLDIGETKAAQELYQRGLKQLLEPSEDVTAIKGRGGKVKNHVNRSGVSKITTWCSLSTTLQGVPEIDRDEDGKALRWRVTVRAAAPDGRVADGVGAFDVKERPSSKPEHDGLGTAFTRARNRAVMDLVGMGEVSAEEMVAGGRVTDGDEMPYGPAADPALSAEAAAAVTQMWGDIDGAVMVRVIGNTLGYFPEVAARTIKGLSWFLSADEGARASVSGSPVAGPQDGSGEATEGVSQGAPPATGPSFDDMVPPTAEANASPGEANQTDSNDPLGDEVDIDAIFDADYTVE